MPSPARHGAVNITVLRPLAQQMIHQHDRHHRFRDRHGTDPDAGIVTTFW